MKTSQPTKTLRSSIQPIFAWIILISCFGIFFSREIAFVGALTGTLLWLLSSKHLHLLIPFVIAASLAFTAPSPFTNIGTPITALAVTIMFWGLTLTTTTLCLHYLLPKDQEESLSNTHS